MTYHMNPALNKICSPVKLLLPTSTLHFSSGSELAAHEFDIFYMVRKITAVDGTIEITAEERGDIDMTWGDESTNLFDG